MKKSERIERRQYWEAQVQRWRASGLTQREFCKKEDLSIERFGAWKRRLDRENQGESEGLVAVPPKIVSSALFTVRPALGLVVDERYRVEIPDAFSPSTLAAVLQVLSRL